MRYTVWLVQMDNVSKDTIYVLDTSSIIQIKCDVKAEHQWELAKNMERMVEQEKITFPRQVTREIRGQLHTDLPEAWVLGVDRKIVIDCEPGHEYIEEVMDKAGNVIESDTDSDPADPYVLALALQIWRSDRDVVVVTEDITDRPLKISIKKACQILGLSMLRLEDFRSDIMV